MITSIKRRFLAILTPYVNRVWSIARFAWTSLIVAKRDFRFPRKSRVLIFDAVGSEFLLEYLRPRNPTIFYARGEVLNVPCLILSLLHPQDIRGAYIDQFIKAVQPELVITFIDNNLRFYSLSNKHPGIKTAFVQNGSRAVANDIFGYFQQHPESARIEQVDYMFVFGAAVGREYGKYLQGTVVPVGSLRNNFVPTTATKQPDLIVYLSVFGLASQDIVLNGVYYSAATFWEVFVAQAERIVLECLADYAKAKEKKLAIMPRMFSGTPIGEAEEHYFQAILGEQCNFIVRTDLFSGYRAVDAAGVAVTIDSTLGYESIARGNKTAIFTFRNGMEVSDIVFEQELSGCYGWPGDFDTEGPFWTTRPDPEAFVRILDFLFALDDEAWLKTVEATNYAPIMLYDPGNTILQSTLDQELGAVPSTVAPEPTLLVPKMREAS